MLNRPSETARPTAVDVKLLLSENITCFSLAAYGAHQPSATTCPCRTNMKLCNSSSFWPDSSINRRIAADDIPCSSGVLRGNFADAGSIAKTKTGTNIANTRAG